MHAAQCIALSLSLSQQCLPEPLTLAAFLYLDRHSIARQTPLLTVLHPILLFVHASSFGHSSGHDYCCFVPTHASIPLHLYRTLLFFLLSRAYHDHDRALDRFQLLRMCIHHALINHTRPAAWHILPTTHIQYRDLSCIRTPYDDISTLSHCSIILAPA